MADKIEELRKLAEDMNIRDARKLYVLAKHRGIEPKSKEFPDGITQAMATEALKTSTQRQLLAPSSSRYKGHFESNGPGNDIQLDVIDFSKTAKKGQHRYAVVGSDVFTRKLDIEPVKSKKPDEVLDASHKIFNELAGEDVGHPHALVRTDKGGEWKGLEKETRTGDQEIHQYTDPANKNSLAVVDAGIKHIKRDLAAEVGKEKMLIGVKKPKKLLRI